MLIESIPRATCRSSRRSRRRSAPTPPAAGCSRATDCRRLVRSPSSLEVNLHTVLRAYQELRDEGLVDMRRGRGAVVTDAVAPLAQLHDDVVALVERARALGLSPDTLAALVKETFR